MENQPAGTLVGRLSARDPDRGDRLTYALVSGVGSGGNGSFEIDGALLKTRAAFDCEVQRSYSIRVRVRDSAGASRERVFVVSVGDANDAPTAIGLESTLVMEQQNVGTGVGRFAAADQDVRDNFTFTLVPGEGSADNAMFAIEHAWLRTNTVFVYALRRSYSIRVRATDSGNPGLSFERVFTMSVVQQPPLPGPANARPTFVRGSELSVLEDAGAQRVPGWANSISPGAAGELGQRVSFVVTGNSNPGLFAAAPALAANGTLTYTPAGDAFGVATITVNAVDDGEPPAESEPQSFTITVAAVNDAPSFTVPAAAPAIGEDAGARLVPGFATAISAGPANESAQTLAFQVVSNSNPALFAPLTGLPTLDPVSGDLRYTAAAAASGTATIAVRLVDDGGRANGGVDESGTQSFTITVGAVNDAPSFQLPANPNQTVLEDSGAHTVTGFASAISAGPPDEATQTLTFHVSNDNNSLFAAQPALDLVSGDLSYTPAPNANGTATMSVTLSDDGGGADTSAAQTFQIQVGAVNDEPSFVEGGDQTVLEDAGAQTVAGWATGISKGPANESGQTLSFHVSTNPLLFSVQPTVDEATGDLTFTPAANQAGAVTVTVFLTDDGGTANGGDDTSATQTFTIEVLSVNDAPSFDLPANADQALGPNPGPQLRAPFATNMSAGPPGEFSSQTLAFHVSSDNDALFSTLPAIDAQTGFLTYAVAAGKFGAATVTVYLQDNGGTANGGVDKSATKTFTIAVDTPPVAQSQTGADAVSVLEDTPQAIVESATDADGDALRFFAVPGAPLPAKGMLSVLGPAVCAGLPSSCTQPLLYTPFADANGPDSFQFLVIDGKGGSDTGVIEVNVAPVNDAPTFTTGGDEFTAEDAGPQTVTGWAQGISAGALNEAGQAVTFEVTANSNPGLFAAAPAVSPTGTLTYTAAADASGEATITLVAKDDGGTANGGADTSAPQSFKITINTVDDPPSFVKGADQSVLEDAGPQSVPNWASAISPGPANESGQTVSFVVIGITNPGLFAAAPAVDSNGTLTFTAAADATGQATITLKAIDDGTPPAESAPQSFDIVVNGVNDAPSFVRGPDLVVAEDAGAQTVAGWASAISAGPADEAAQTLQFEVVSNSNPGLFAPVSGLPVVDAATGDVTFTAAANAHGSADITIRLTDNGGTANGGVDTSAPQTLTITVGSVNDAPTFNLPASPDQLVLEDSGPQTVPGFATQISAGPPDEAAQTLTFHVSNDNNSLFAAQPTISEATGALSYTPAANANGSATVSVFLTDDGGTANGGQDASAPQTFTITVAAVNDEPSFDLPASPNQTVLNTAGAQTLPAFATNISRGPANEAGQALSFQVSTDNDALFAVKPAIDATTGDLTYTPAVGAHGSATVSVALTDDGGTANGGDDTSATKTFTITVNTPPLAQSQTGVNAVAAVEDTAAQIVLSATDADGDALTFSVVSSPGKGSLAPVGPVVCAGNPSTCTWTLSYMPAPNANGADSFTFTVNDGQFDSNTATVDIDIAAVNDAPSFSKGADETVAEDSGAHAVAGWATAISAGPTDESAQTVSFEVTGNTNPGLFSVAPAVSASGELTYTLAADANGSATITVKLNDDGGTANGGVDASPTQTFTITVTAVNDTPSFALPASPDQEVLEDSGVAGAHTVSAFATAISAGAANESGQTLTFQVSNDNNALFATQPVIDTASGDLTYTLAPDANGFAIVSVTLSDDGGATSAARTFAIVVAAVNDEPGFDLPASRNQRVVQDTGPQTVAGFATNISPGPANESTQTVTFHVSNDNTGVFSVQPSIDPASGDLTYTPAAGQTGVATVSVFVTDDGGTADGGDDTSATKTFTITVTPPNTAPGAQSQTGGSGVPAFEDTTVQITLSAIDTDGDPLTFAIVSGPANGTLGTFGPVNCSGSPSNCTQTVDYTPNANANGTDSFTFKANDGFADSNVATVEVNVVAVNDAPSFAVPAAAPSVLEDAGTQVVAGFASAVSAGAANESGQTLTFVIVSNSNPGLFAPISGLPLIDPTSGNLSYTPAANMSGTATIEVRLTDNGGFANGGVDQSATQSFTITVTPVNDAPGFTKGADQTVLEDAGAQTVPGWATGIGAGPGESGQTVSFEVIDNTNPGLFSAGPAVSSTGTLTFTPAANANGTATITLRARDDGGTANGGVDASPTQTFDITVTAVNDVPSFTKGANQTVLEDAGAQTVAGWASAISAGPANESGQAVSFEITNNTNTALFSAAPAVAANGTLTYTPAANASGTATITLRIKDDGGTANGGVDTSATQSFDITVTAVNDAPSFTKGGNQTVLEDVGAQTVAGWATGISSGPANEAAQTISFEVTNNTNAALFSAGPAVSSTGALTFTPAANAFGTATITLRARDSGGTANGGVDVSPTQSFDITVTGVNDAPSFSKGANQTVLEDAGAQTVAGWASAISAGPGETGQAVSFEITNNTNAALFSAAPAVSPTGTLTFTPAANANGTATITLRIKDDGGTANGGVDTSATQSFDITVTAVNDAPSFTKGANQTVAEDAAAQTVPNWATAISAGPANESGQTVSFVVTNNSKPGLFSAGPAVSPTGTLTYTPAANQNGTATITIKITDSGGTANGGVNESATQTFDITVTAVNDAPTSTGRAYGTSSLETNMQRSFDAASGLLAPASVADANDVAGNPTWTPTFTVGTINGVAPVSGTITTTIAGVGTVVANAATGAFTIDPAPGVTGNVSFNYTVCDNGDGPPASQCSAAATASFNISGPVIWFVDVNTPIGGTGTLASPFKTLAAADAVDAANHRVFLYSGATATGLTLNTGEWLIGQAATGPFDTLFGIAPPGGTIARPAMGSGTTTIGGTVTLATNARVQGVAISTGATTGLTGSGAISGITVSESSITTSTGTALNLDNATGTYSLSSVSTNGAANAILLNALGTTNVTVGGGTIVNASTRGIDINGGTGSFSYAGTITTTAAGRSVEVTSHTGGTVTLSGAVSDSGLGINLDANTGATIDFTGSVAVSSGINTAFSATGGGTINLSAGATRTLTTTTGTALNLNGVGGTITLTDLDKNGTGTGISLTNVAAAVTIPAGATIAATTVAAVDIDGGTGAFSYAGTISNSTGRTVEVTARNTGSPGLVEFTGSVIATGGTGVNLDDNDNGTATFSGGLVLSTGASAAFNASRGGTVNVTGAANTLTTTTGTALNVSSTNIGASGLTFRSISANGGANGIVLNSTGTAAGNGGLTVTGNGGACTAADTTCTGGTIQGMVGADSSSFTPAGTGIALNSTKNPSFTRIHVKNTSNYGIRGDQVTGFSLANSLIDGTNGTNEASPFSDGSISFDTLLGTNTITGSEISGGWQRNIRVDHAAGVGGGTMTLNVTNNNIHDTVGTAPDDGVFVEAENTDNYTVNITGNTMANHGGDHINVDMINSATIAITITGNNMQNPTLPVRLGGGIFVFGASWNGTGTYNVSGNTILRNRQGGAIHMNKGSGTGSLTGTVSNNIIGTSGVNKSGSIEASGIVIGARGAGGTHTALVEDNQVYGWNDRAIIVENGEGNSTLNATVRGNTADTFDSINGLHGFHADLGILSTDAGSVCLDLGGLTADRNHLTNAGNEAQGGVDVRVRLAAAVNLRLPGYAGGATDDAAVTSYLTGRNDLTTTLVSSPGSGAYSGGAACPVP